MPAIDARVRVWKCRVAMRCMLDCLDHSPAFFCIWILAYGSFHPCLLDVSLLTMGSYTPWLPHLDHHASFTIDAVYHSPLHLLKMYYPNPCSRTPKPKPRTSRTPMSRVIGLSFHTLLVPGLGFRSVGLRSKRVSISLRSISVSESRTSRDLGLAHIHYWC